MKTTSTTLLPTAAAALSLISLVSSASSHPRSITRSSNAPLPPMLRNSQAQLTTTSLSAEVSQVSLSQTDFRPTRTSPSLSSKPATPATPITTNSSSLLPTSTILPWEHSTIGNGKTSPQEGLSGRSASWPRGKVLGGSSAINGLYYVRHSDTEQNAWADLIGDDQDGDWNWGKMLMQ